MTHLGHKAARVPRFMVQQHILRRQITAHTRSRVNTSSHAIICPYTHCSKSCTWCSSVSVLCNKAASSVASVPVDDVVRVDAGHAIGDVQCRAQNIAQIWQTAWSCPLAVQVASVKGFLQHASSV